MEVRSKRSTVSFILYIVLLFTSATTRDFGVSPFIAHTFGNIAVAFVEPVWKAIFWIIPMVLLLVYNGKQPAHYLKLAGNVRRGLVWGIGAGLYFFVLGIGGELAQGNHLSFQHSLNDWLNSVVLVGLVEETIFRGLLYQWIEQAFASKNTAPKNSTNEGNEDIIRLKKQLPRQSEIGAALLSTLLFAAIHFPTWIETSTSMTIMTTTTAFNIFFGLVACALLKYSNSLWSCILAHTANDLALLLR